MQPIGVGIIGTGQIALANHLPRLALRADAAKVVALCDNDPATLEKASRQVPTARAYVDWHDILGDDRVHALIVATPNFAHPPIALAAVAAGRHVMCEKPLALNFADALTMYRAAEAARVVHMTAFTYRFVPAMRYMKHLIDRGDLGEPYHFRAQRFQDWGDRALGWRQRKDLAGTGELADMLSHRIDYAHHLIGRIDRLVADMKNFLPARPAQDGKPSDVDDWVSILCKFERAPTTGVLESTKLATGRGEGHRGQDTVEINGSAGTIVYSTQKPLTLQIGKKGDADLHSIDVPREFLVYPGSPRDPDQGDPLVTFRYDQAVEFIDAIAKHRPASPSFRDGAAVQAVMEAAVQSSETRAWVEVEKVTP
jgi:predicted dehydrogenase